MAETVTFQPIKWEVSMATGVSQIDKQHRYLVETLQELNEKLLDDESDLLLSKVVKDLLGYALMHFETEERLMQRYGYAIDCPEEAQVHIAQHRTFSRQVTNISDQLREGQKVSRSELLRFLNHWLRDHVLGIDQSLGKYLMQKMGEGT